jgi:hypothetical protein
MSKYVQNTVIPYEEEPVKKKAAAKKRLLLKKLAKLRRNKSWL